MAVKNAETTKKKEAGLYRLLQAGTLLLSLGLCLGLLLRHGGRLNWREIFLFSLLTTAPRLRVVVFRRDAEGRPTDIHVPGGAILLAALLRDGPLTALAVAVLSLPLSMPLLGRYFKNMEARPLGDPFFFCALTWIWGMLYGLLGGQPVRTMDDCGRLFQQPFSVILPLCLASLIVYEAALRSYAALTLHLRDGEPFRRALLGTNLGLFYHSENLSGLLGLALWTAWGWGVLPLALLTHEALLLSARSYYERLDAVRVAGCDPLTGLASWRGIESFLNQRLSLARMRRTPLALLFIDADGLKYVNDRHGHASGDELLRLIGDCCRAQTRERDLAGRRGGDEFLVILDGADRPTAERVMARLQRAVQDELAAHPRFASAPTGISIGLSLYPADAQDTARLIAVADQQMYANKMARQAARLSPI